MTENGKSSSIEQLVFERPITSLVIKHIEQNFDASTENYGSNLVFENEDKVNINFQVDFYNKEKTIFGEIYVCKFPLKSGHLRKIKGDILKLLTIEKILGEPIQKYMVLTIESALTEKQGKIQTEENLKKFGNDSWFSETIKIFNINILYYTLTPDEANNLNEVRKRQKEGMKISK